MTNAEMVKADDSLEVLLTLLLTRGYLPEEAFLLFTTCCRALYQAYKTVATHYPGVFPLRAYFNILPDPRHRLGVDKKAIMQGHPQSFLDLLGGYNSIVKKIPFTTINPLDHVHKLEKTPILRGWLPGYPARCFYIVWAHMLTADNVNVSFCFKLIQRYAEDKQTWITCENDKQLLTSNTLSAKEIMWYLLDRIDESTQDGLSMAHSFLAKLISTGKVSYPNVTVDPEFRTIQAPPRGEALLPEENEPNYRAIRLG